MEIYKEFTFDAAHKLPKVSEAHKCRRLHGHTFRLRIYLEGPVGGDSGWVQDFTDVAKVCGPLLDELDHNYLNDIEGLENPTSENIAIWVWDRIKPALPLLSRIEINESPSSGAIYRGE
ncbi:MAG: 6-carboxytetrahydropterin synthase QueD [bacterium]|nr:6-carboxytetrahydropterin synthase QueD [bacterium]